MTTKVKGLLRGLRYISQMFDEKEQEMQIGLPTDVKHVAHIGWDGPSENPPSWMNAYSKHLQMNEFASPPEALSGTSNSKEVKNLSTDSTLEGQTEKPKHSSRRSSVIRQRVLGVTALQTSQWTLQGKNHQGAAEPQDDTKASSLGAESHIQDLPSIPKAFSWKKVKGVIR
ncbi:hypothetical protein OIU77_014670 [Salix suchowensis]|uniref:CRIB domain-containing protein n=1 Tax=Salix suchowensis TaxID=1278906 RepID=A0ABQ8ZYL3_9ROSI|nr:hypothetical protein OIU77_014670 [Salix suchowensis]